MKETFFNGDVVQVNPDYHEYSGQLMWVKSSNASTATVSHYVTPKGETIPHALQPFELAQIPIENLRYIGKLAWSSS